MANQPKKETSAARAAREERERQDANATRRAEADAAAARAQADASARTAEAQARAAAAQAEADANRMRAEAEAARIKADAEAAKRRSDAEDAARKTAEANAPRERLYQLGINIAGPLAGIVLGTKLASKLTAQHAAGVAAANKQLKDIGSAITKALPKSGAPKAATIAKLTGFVKAADALKLAGRPGALGIATAGILLAEGAFSRFVLGPQAQAIDPTAGEAVKAVGTASLFAATTLVGKRILANATTPALPDAKSLAAVETARKLIPPAAVAAPGMLARVASALPTSKGALIVGSGAAVAAVATAVTSTGARAAPESMPAKPPAPGAPPSLLSKAADVALSTATTASAAKLVVSKAALAGAGILARLSIPVAAGMAVVGGVKGYSETGTIGGAAEGAADGLTGGGYSALKSMVQRAAASPGPVSGAVDLMRGAAGRVVAAMATTSTIAPGMGAGLAVAGPPSDGQTNAYTRTQDGRRVFVHGYSTPSR